MEFIEIRVEQKRPEEPFGKNAQPVDPFRRHHFQTGQLGRVEKRSEDFHISLTVIKDVPERSGRSAARALRV
jgi:hypothetical protein